MDQLNDICLVLSTIYSTKKKMYPSNFYHQLFDFFDKFDLICLYFTADFFSYSFSVQLNDICLVLSTIYSTKKKMYPSNFYHQLFDFFDKFDLICLYFTTDFFFLFFFCRILYSWLYKFTADFTNLYALQLTLQICMLYFQLEDCIT